MLSGYSFFFNFDSTNNKVLEHFIESFSLQSVLHKKKSVELHQCYFIEMQLVQIFHIIVSIMYNL